MSTAVIGSESEVIPGRRRRSTWQLGLLLAGLALPATAAVQLLNKGKNGIIDVPSNYSADETVERVKSILKAKGATLFALIDHSGEAEKVGMKMPPTRLLIFGSPKAGTPLMLASPSIAIDLPLKILVREDTGGKVWISYNYPDYLGKRHHLPAGFEQKIAVAGAVAREAAA